MAVAKVAKVIEITSASSESFEDAIRQGIAQVVAGASHLFEEPGTLETVAHLAERLVRPPPCPNPGIQAGASESLTQGESSMGVCEVCGNNYDKSMEIFVRERTHVFDCFECAIHALAPRCAQCLARSSDTASSTTAPSTAAHTAPTPPAYRRPSIASSALTGTQVHDVGRVDGDQALAIPVVLRELDGALPAGRLQALVHLSVLVADPDRLALTQPDLR